MWIKHSIVAWRGGRTNLLCGSPMRIDEGAGKIMKELKCLKYTFRYSLLSDLLHFNRNRRLVPVKYPEIYCSGSPLQRSMRLRTLAAACATPNSLTN